MAGAGEDAAWGSLTRLSEPPHHFVPFDDDMRLAEVILGDRCQESLEAFRERLQCKFPSVVAFKARLAYRSFRVVLNGHTRPCESPAK